MPHTLHLFQEQKRHWLWPHAQECGLWNSWWDLKEFTSGKFISHIWHTKLFSARANFQFRFCIWDIGLGLGLALDNYIIWHYSKWESISPHQGSQGTIDLWELRTTCPIWPGEEARVADDALLMTRPLWSILWHNTRAHLRSVTSEVVVCPRGNLYALKICNI